MNLDDLLNSIRNESEVPSLDDLIADVQGKKKKKINPGALLTISSFKKSYNRGTKKREQIDESLLSLLGIEDVFDLDYEDYMQLIRERLQSGSFGKEKLSELDLARLANERKRVRGKKGRFKVVKAPVKREAKGRISSKTKLLSGNKILQQKTSEEKVAPEKLTSIDEALDNILKSIRDDAKLEKEIADDSKKKKENETRKKKEEKLEKGRGKKLLKKAKKVIKPFQSIFDRIFKFLLGVVAGRLFVKITEWFGDKENEKKVNTLTKFVKDWWPALTAAFLAFATPLGGFIRTVVGTITKLTLKLGAGLVKLVLKNPKAALATGLTVGTVVAGNELRRRSQETTSNMIEEKGLEDMSPEEQANELSKPGNILETFTRMILPSLEGYSGGGMAMGTDTVPAMLTPGEFVMSRGAVNTFGTDFMESINAAGGGTNKPRTIGGVSYAAGGGLVSHHKALLDAISFAEGTTKSYGTIFGGKVVPELEQGKLTIDQVHNMMMTGKLNGRDVGYKTGGKWSSVATGRYQFMPDTLRDIQRSMRLSGDTLFTPEMQDKMIIDRITKFRNVSLNELKTEGLSTKVLDKLAPEFASLPSSQKGGKSYYGQPVKSAKDIRNTFNKSLTGGGGSAATAAIASSPRVSGKVKESTGMDIPGATADRQLIPPMKVQPGEFLQVFTKDFVDKGGMQIVQFLQALFDPDSNARESGVLTKQINLNALKPSPKRKGGGQMTLPPITQSTGGQATQVNNTVPKFSAVSVVSGDVRNTMINVYGIRG